MKINFRASFSMSLALLTRLLQLNLFILFFMSLYRLLLYFYYAPASELPLKETLMAFWMGVRFDSVVLFYLAFIPFLFVLSAWLLKNLFVFEKLSFVIRTYYALALTLLVFVGLIDFVYYSYFQDHINILVFGMIEDDTAALVRTMWKNYPVVPVFAIYAAVIVLIWKYLGTALKITPTFLQNVSRRWATFPIWLSPFVFVFVFVFLGIGARGSFGLFPLSIMDTSISSHPFLNYLCYNGVHSFQRASKLKSREQAQWNANVQYFGEPDVITALSDHLQIPKDKIPIQDPFSVWQKTAAKNMWAEKARPHVILVVMESFGGHWLKYHSSEFNLLGSLDPHWKSDYVFENFFPSSPATIGSLAALMVGLPHRPFGPFLTESQFLNVQFSTSVPLQFKKNGYRTRFIYGGNPTWRDIDKFARKQGFDTVEGQVDVEKVLGGLKETHDWGVYDNDLFAYTYKTLSAAPANQPELIVIMTTSNHPPYETPKKYHAHNLNMPEELRSQLVVDTTLATNRFRCFQYANDSLGNFLSEIKSAPWAERAVVAVTGDHGFMVTNFNEQEILEKWKVPLLIHLPEGAKKLLPAKIDAEAFGSHMDIFPTLYPLVLSNQKYWSIGRSIFVNPEESFAIHTSQTAASAAGAVIISRQGQKNNIFPIESSSEKNNSSLAVQSQTAELENLAQRYKGLMSALDFFMHSEQKRK